jgi:hypothetical protein
MENEPELLSLYVAPSVRHRGIGGALTEAFEGAVAAAGYSRVTGIYMTGHQAVGYLEKLLSRRKWSEPEVRMRVYKSTLEQATCTPWYSRYRQDSRLRFFLWSELQPEQLAALKRSHGQSAWIADDLRPWQYPVKDLDAASSIGVQLGEDVVGWVLNHRVSAETVRFTCAFIRQDLSRRARLLPAISDSIRRASEAGFRNLMFTVPAHHPEMTRFAERWCAPYSSFHGETRSSYKVLISGKEGQTHADI